MLQRNAPEAVGCYRSWGRCGGYSCTAVQFPVLGVHLDKKAFSGLQIKNLTTPQLFPGAVLAALWYLTHLYKAGRQRHRVCRRQHLSGVEGGAQIGHPGAAQESFWCQALRQLNSAPKHLHVDGWPTGLALEWLQQVRLDCW